MPLQMTPLRELPAHPLTAGVGLASLGLSLSAWADVSVERVVMGAMALHGEPFRLLTSIFVHGGALHLLFNLYWLWVLGSYLERELGALRYLVLIVVSAAISGLAQYGISGSGIGLSGVGYANVGALWMLARLDPRHRHAMDRATVGLFLIWGAFCIVATQLELMRVANVAHGGGLLVGVLAGIAHAGRLPARALATLALVACAALSVLAATTYRPLLTRTDRDAAQHCYLGFAALAQAKDSLAHRLLEDAARYPDTSGDCWHNIGVARMRMHDDEGAQAAFARAQALRGFTVEPATAP